MPATQAAQLLVVELDDRRRTSLGRIGHTEHRRYIADVHLDGTIVLKPAQIVTEAQLRFLATSEAMRQVDEAQTAYDADPHDPRIIRGAGLPSRRTVAS
jgi:hypothetical protein